MKPSLMLKNLIWNQLFQFEGSNFYKEGIVRFSLNLASTKFKLNDGSNAPYGLGWKKGEIKDWKTIKHDGIITGFIFFTLSA